MTDSKSACEKCDCPQSKHRAVKPRGTLQDRPDVESYCENCGAEDCWHFTGYTPPAPKPSTVEERCAYQLHDGTTCDASRESHVACGDKWCHAFVAPATPAAPEAVLTRDLVVRMVNAAMFGWPDTNEPAKLLAHDAALRERVEKLEKDLAEADEAVEIQRAEIDFLSGNAALEEAWKAAEAAEASRDRLAAALRKIAERHIPTYSINFEWMREIANDHRRIAAAALKGE